MLIYFPKMFQDNSTKLSCNFFSRKLFHVKIFKFIIIINAKLGFAKIEANKKCLQNYCKDIIKINLQFEYCNKFLKVVL